MKRILAIALLVGISQLGYSQIKKLGVGVQTYSQALAGVFVELDGHKVQNNNFQTITRVSLGFRNQTSEHNAINLELQRGFHMKVGNSYFFEQTVGLGAMYSIYSEKYWYKNDWHNIVFVGSNGRKWDVIPSASFSFGKTFGAEANSNSQLWIRPKVFLQIPTNDPSNFNFTVQVGYSRILSKN